MHIIKQYSRVKVFLVVLALAICSLFVFVSQVLVKDLSDQERMNMAVWAEAMRSLNDAGDDTDLSLVLQVINGNSYIPVIVLDAMGEVQTYRNLNLGYRAGQDSIAAIRQAADEMKQKGHLITIDIDGPSDIPDNYIEICYDDSIMLKRLSAYPYVALSVVVAFFTLVVFALLSSKKAEQNKVWVGLSKETAHQLGTPLSSLLAWVEILKENYPEDELLPEMDKDVKRLEVITERFSKIGSLPELKVENLSDIVQNAVMYMENRVSRKISITLDVPDTPCPAKLSASLFEWVIENLCKNAVDAITNEGEIRIVISNKDDSCYLIDVSDTGKGISKKNYKDVFRPGYTTKTRGWGLGLSLAKRIVEEYHKGKIYVLKSEQGKGTTFRIELKKH